MNSTAPEKFDVAIVGAGPAGSAAAIRLARGGLSVILIERARFPREKLCGEFVSPECARHFSELGVDSLTADRFPRIDRTVFYSQRGRSIEFRSDWFGMGDAALGISRADMDERLLNRAHVAGAEVRSETTVLDAEIVSGSSVRLRLRGLDGSVNVIKTQIAIDASGRKRILGSNTAQGAKASKVAFKTHLTGAKVSRNQCEIYSYRGGYGGCNAVGGDRYNLCFIADAKLVRTIGSDGEKVMRSLVFANKAAQRALDRACFDEDWLAVPVDGFGRRSAAENGRLFFIGDAAAFIDPFTGSGILLALQSAELCANTILEGIRAGLPAKTFAQNYQRGYHRLLANRLRISGLLRPASSSPGLAEMIIALASKSERLRSALARATRFSGVSDV